jgi:hypothetical protein
MLRRAGMGDKQRIMRKPGKGCIGVFSEKVDTGFPQKMRPSKYGLAGLPAISAIDS